MAPLPPIKFARGTAKDTRRYSCAAIDKVLIDTTRRAVRLR